MNAVPIWAAAAAGGWPPRGAWAFLRHLEARLPPQAVHTVAAEHVALALEEDPDRAVAVPRILCGQRRNRPHHIRVAGDELRDVADRGSGDGE
jgi:hypothetical protein